ncbi:MAG: O-methyltransferase [Solirubrobacteraceae bacterium]
MSWELWNAVDEYTAGLLIGPDPVLDEALAASEAAGLPPIAVTANQGRLLNLLIRIHGAASVLEVGTLGGYSTIWMARGLSPQGRLISLELDPGYAAVAAANVARAGLSERVEIRVGPALDSLAALREEGAGPFDLAFIDADKQRTPEYFAFALEMVRPGGLILTDNVVRDGAVADPDSADAGAQGMRRFLAMAAAEPRVTATTIQTVGSKGYDGFTLALLDG